MSPVPTAPAPVTEAPAADLSALPVAPLFELARAYARQSAAQGRDQWRTGLPFSQCFGALQRHAFLYWSGQTFDPQTQVHHLAHVALWAFQLIEHTVSHPELDDRPGPVVSPEKSLAEWCRIIRTTTEQTT
jgi:hypothetical protein